MFVIQNPDGALHFGANAPTDEILEGLLAHYGADVRIVNATTLADHDAMTAHRNAMDRDVDPPLPVGNTLGLADDGLTIEGRDRDGALVATWPGVLIYTPADQRPAAAPPEPVDLAALHQRMVALGSSLDELAVAMGLKAGQPITPAVAATLAQEVTFQEETAKLPRVGQFGGVAAPAAEAGPQVAPEPNPAPGVVVLAGADAPVQE